MKKEILIIGAIIVILVIVLGVKIIMPKEEKVITTEQIKEKMLSFYNYTNYTYEIMQEGEKTTKKVKDNIIVTESEEIISWIDGNTDTLIAINKKEKNYTTLKLDSTNKEALYKKDFLDMKSLINIYGDELYYINDENCNGRKCWLIQVGKDNTKYWIDEETGFVLKYEYESGNGAEFNIKINNVTDKDVESPDLSRYTKVT